MKEILMKQIFVEAKSGQIDFVSHISEFITGARFV